MPSRSFVRARPALCSISSKKYHDPFAGGELLRYCWVHGQAALHAIFFLEVKQKTTGEVRRYVSDTGVGTNEH